jgi:hypothetical protein
MSTTLFLVTPDGRGVMVVKVAVFGILKVCCRFTNLFVHG